jgi:hypothetical protein|nr:MAG TPA: hypothetical protein [Caudoviricetes sp.]
MKAIYRGVACTELFNKKIEVPEHKSRTFEKTPEEIKKALKIEKNRKKYSTKLLKQEIKNEIF